MPVLTQKQIEAIPRIIVARMEVIGSWLKSQAKDSETKLLEQVSAEIKKGMTPMYGFDNCSSVRRCMDKVSLSRN